MKPHAGYVPIHFLHCAIAGLLRLLCALGRLGAIFISPVAMEFSPLHTELKGMIRGVPPRLRNRMCGAVRGPHHGGIGGDGLIRVSPPALARLRCALPGRNEMREERGGGPNVRLQHRFGWPCRCDRDKGASRRLHWCGPGLLPTRLPL
jgi:hypothetical protein